MNQSKHNPTLWSYIRGKKESNLKFKKKTHQWKVEIQTSLPRFSKFTCEKELKKEDVCAETYGYWSNSCHLHACLQHFCGFCGKEVAVLPIYFFPKLLSPSTAINIYSLHVDIHIYHKINTGFSHRNIFSQKKKKSWYSASNLPFLLFFWCPELRCFVLTIKMFFFSSEFPQSPL